MEKITQDLKERDYQDTNRKIAPLIFTEGCIKINTDNLTIDQTADLIIDLFKKEVNNV
ncbi:MAG: (d)CMP kinase [Mycoplasmoidaceae bacterium]|nr:(d)CMP kinase [Mycoplasmoidaceae bacterium]